MVSEPWKYRFSPQQWCLQFGQILNLTQSAVSVGGALMRDCVLFKALNLASEHVCREEIGIWIELGYKCIYLVTVVYTIPGIAPHCWVKRDKKSEIDDYCLLHLQTYCSHKYLRQMLIIVEIYTVKCSCDIDKLRKETVYSIGKHTGQHPAKSCNLMI